MNTYDAATASLERRHKPEWERPWHVRWGYGCVEKFATGTEADAFYEAHRDYAWIEPPTVVLPRLSDS